MFFFNQIRVGNDLISDMIEKVYIEYVILKSQEDKSFLEKLIQLIQPKILNYCQRQISHPQLAQDAMQDTLLEVFSKIHKLKDHRRFHAWMYKVCHNKCIDVLRKLKPEMNQQLIEKQEEYIASKDTLNSNAMDIHNVIKKLSAKHKTVITLFYYEGFSVKEIAAILKTPAGTVKSDLFYARGLIKDSLEK